MSTKLAVCQAPDIQQDPANALGWIDKFARAAEEKGVSLVCFPECFLQGYLTEDAAMRKHAINLQSETFAIILQRLASYDPMIVLGLIEESDGLLFNTAVVIKEGILIGKYRKTHLLNGEMSFTAGTEYPVFQVEDLIFGISICYDTQFPEAICKLTDQGAQLIVCPSNTMMSLKKADKFKYRHLEMRAERVKEKSVWLLSSDVTGERPGRVAYGTASIIQPDGEISSQVPFLQTGMLVVEL